MDVWLGTAYTTGILENFPEKWWLQGVWSYTFATTLCLPETTSLASPLQDTIGRRHFAGEKQQLGKGGFFFMHPPYHHTSSRSGFHTHISEVAGPTVATTSATLPWPFPSWECQGTKFVTLVPESQHPSRFWSSSTNCHVQGVCDLSDLPKPRSGPEAVPNPLLPPPLPPPQSP